MQEVPELDLPESDELDWVGELWEGQHICHIYSTDREHRRVLTPYMREGLEGNERVTYIVDQHSAQEVMEYLEDVGIDVDSYRERGQLRVLTAQESYMREGTFSPEKMIGLLRAETEKAVEEGYDGLRVTGEMTWAVGDIPGSDRLIEYESKLNEFLPGSRATALCQYDTREFDPEILLDVLSTHPYVIAGTKEYDNFYYVEPEVFLSEEPEKGVLEQRLENLEAWDQHLEAIRASRKYQKLFEQGEDGILVVRDGKVALANPQFVRMLGYREEEVLGENFLDMVPEGERERIEGFYEDRVAGREAPEKYEMKVLKKDGSTIPIEVNPTLVEISGEPAVMAILRDISQKKEYRDALEERNSQLEILNRLVRHDIRNDMNVVLGLAGEVERHVDDEGEEALEDLVEVSKHVVELTKTARDFVLSLTQESEIELSSIRIAQVLEREVEVARRSYPYAELEMENEAPEAEVRANELLSSVFRNLINNGIQHNGGEKPEVDIVVREEGGEVVVEVADNGPGLPEEFKEAINGGLAPTGGKGLGCTSFPNSSNSSRGTYRSRMGRGRERSSE